MINRRSLLLAGLALPVAARAQCVTDKPAVDACRGGVRTIVVEPPALDLSLMNPGTLPSGVTFSRASTGTYFDVGGIMQTAATNTPRWDYHPTTHVLQGLLLEESRTNSLLNSATLGTQPVTVTAQAYALSFYGTGTVTLSGASAAGPLTGTGAGNRVALTFTPTAGTLTLTVTGTVSNAQLEAGSYPTSYIPTTAAAVTRALDSATMPVGAWYNAAAGSLVGEYVVPNVPNPSNRTNGACGISDNTANNRLILRGQSANNAFPVAITSVAGTTVATPLLPAIVSNAVTKLGSSWNGSLMIAVLNGTAAVSNATSLPAPGVLTTLMLGNDMPSVVNAYLNGWLRRVRYWPRAMSVGELQSVTA